MRAESSSAASWWVRLRDSMAIFDASRSGSSWATTSAMRSAGAADHLHLLAVQVAAAVLGGGDATFDEGVALLDLGFEPGNHGVGLCGHGYSSREDQWDFT